MATLEETKLAQITQALEQKFQAGLTLELTETLDLQDLSNVAAELGLSSFIGSIAFAGQTSSGSYSVQFNADGGSGYSSTWPQWAFEQAKSALLYGKKVWVLSNGNPFGMNLVQVLIFA